jgi:hypothetical protein
MDAPPSELPEGRREVLNRRRLLWLAGSVGLGATVAGCSDDRPTANSAATAMSGNTPPVTPPPASAAPPPTATTASTPLLCRDAWHARPPRPGGVPHNITQMTIHHTGAVLGDNRNAPSRLLQHQRLHQDERGWIDIAYHVSVDRNGNIYELRTTDLAGDTATNYNPAGHFLVLCEGDFDQEPITDAQLHGAAVAFAWATQKFHITSDTPWGAPRFRGHRLSGRKPLLPHLLRETQKSHRRPASSRHRGPSRSLRARRGCSRR